MADDSRKLNAAEIQFKKTQQPGAAKKVVAQYETEAIALGKKTEALKALRLARDAEEAAARPAVPEKKKRAARKTAARRKPLHHAEGSETLAGWWKNQREDGRSN